MAQGSPFFHSSWQGVPSRSRQERRFPCVVWKGFPAFPAHPAFLPAPTFPYFLPSSFSKSPFLNSGLQEPPLCLQCFVSRPTLTPSPTRVLVGQVPAYPAQSLWSLPSVFPAGLACTLGPLQPFPTLVAASLPSPAHPLKSPRAAPSKPHSGLAFFGIRYGGSASLGSHRGAISYSPQPHPPP